MATPTARQPPLGARSSSARLGGPSTDAFGRRRVRVGRIDGWSPNRISARSRGTEPRLQTASPAPIRPSTTQRPSSPRFGSPARRRGFDGPNRPCANRAGSPAPIDPGLCLPSPARGLGSAPPRHWEYPPHPSGWTHPRSSIRTVRWPCLVAPTERMGSRQTTRRTEHEQIARFIKRGHIRIGG